MELKINKYDKNEPDFLSHTQIRYINSIKNEIFQLPDETLVYCGHGNETTIKAEKSSNPFLY